MARIQILEIDPAETPMEDLSYDIAGNITGGGLLNEITDLIERLINFSDKVLDALVKR